EASGSGGSGIVLNWCGVEPVTRHLFSVVARHRGGMRASSRWSERSEDPVSLDALVLHRVGLSLSQCKSPANASRCFLLLKPRSCRGRGFWRQTKRKGPRNER